jgi:hypothetical protein
VYSATAAIAAMRCAVITTWTADSIGAMAAEWFDRTATADRACPDIRQEAAEPSPIQAMEAELFTKPVVAVLPCTFPVAELCVPAASSTDNACAPQARRIAGAAARF